MGIYGVKSNNCECRGNWCTLDSDHRVYMNKPCSKHRLEIGNSIYYELHHLLMHITKYDTNNTKIIKYKPKYLVKILDIQKLDIPKYNRNTCIKFEFKHDINIDIANFNESKNIIYSQFNDEPMWKKIDNNTIHLIVLYQGCHHTVETSWEAADY